MAAQREYAKPVVTPERLDLLTGPTTGVVTLPRHLKWSGSNRYDLTNPAGSSTFTAPFSTRP